MGKRKNKGRKQSKTGLARKQGDTGNDQGFDYAFLPMAAAVGIADFPQKLRDTEIIGVAYGLAFSTLLGRTVPSVSLIGRNAAQLTEAFSEFARWADASDGDALEVTIVLLNKGGYLLGLSPEKHRLAIRWVPSPNSLV